MLESARAVMGMTARVAIAEVSAATSDMDAVFDLFEQADARFSPFRADSELMRLNRGEAGEKSPAMREIMALAENARAETKGYFDIRRPDGGIDTSGIVKGWAIRQAARLLQQRGFGNFAVEVGGDIQTSGVKSDGSDWCVGIKSPFDAAIVKVLYPRGAGVATSGSYHQGAHIYDPHGGDPAHDRRSVVSLTVIGPDIMAADILATAAFAMGRDGILFVENSKGFEGYAIDENGKARMTNGLKRYLA